MYITKEEDLANVCEKLKDCDTLALDTEFVREKTYFHRLGLIQVAGNGICAAIDPIHISDLTPFLELSSTRIRYAAEAGDPLGAMLPDGVAELIAGEGLYRGAPPGVLSPWRGELDGLQRELERAAGKLSARLTHNQAAGKAHSFSLVEASVGGLLTHAFGGRSGASVFFRQARFAYDLHAKETLIGGGLEGRSAVSDEGAVALAQGMRAQGATDFALAETGMAGPPDGRRRSFKNGLCHIALVTPKAVHTERIQLNPFATRREHQYRFAIHALNKTSQWLDQDGF